MELYGEGLAVVIKKARSSKKLKPEKLARVLGKKGESPPTDLALTALPSIRFFDGRGANRPWLCEIPDPLSRIAWQTPVIIHPDTAKQKGIAQQDIIQIQSETGSLEAPVYLSEIVSPLAMVMAIGQGHSSYGRYARNTRANELSANCSNVAMGAGSSSTRG